MKIVALCILIALLGGCQSASTQPSVSYFELPAGQKADTATFAGGCFWCVEAAFEQIRGVYEVVSGYAGARLKPPITKP